MSKIVLYKNCRILEDKNMQVDDILTYLGTLSTPKVYNNAQLIKNVNDVDLSIKVALDQDYMEKDVVDNYNYCSISNDTSDNDTYFYFIRKINWKSKECLELELHLDVLNTFKGEYTLTDKTTIQRMHKDRFASKVDRSWSKTGYLDELDVWDWSSDVPGEMVGRATFNLSDDFIGEDFNKDLVIFEYDQEPYARNLWEFNRDVINNTITITMYIQSEQIPQQSYGVFIAYKSLLRDVDYIDEGITPLLYKKSEEVIYDEPHMKWYLMYKNAGGTGDNAVDTWLIPENSIKIDYRTTDVENALNSNTHISSSTDAYYVFGGEYGLNQYHYDDQNYIPVYGSDDGTEWKKLFDVYTKRNPGTSTFKSNHYTQFAMMQHDGNKIIIKKGIDEQKSTTQMSLKNMGSYTYIRFGEYKNLKYKQSSTILTAQNMLFKLGKIVKTSDSEWDFTGGDILTAQTTSIDTIQKTDASIVKIIELPYCPAEIKYNSNTHSYILNNLERSIWEFNTTAKMFKQKIYGVNIRLEQTIKNTYNPISDLKLLATNISTSQNRDDINESKLYHSSYHLNKYVYDSFNYGLALENYDINNFTTDWNIHYLVANTCNTKFMFDLPNFYNRLSTQDYDNMFTITRSNEITITNSSYINYLRTGYNYDQKTRVINTMQSLVNVGATAAKGAVGGAISGGSAGPVGAAFGAVLGAAGGMFNTIVSVTEAERAQMQKMNELKNQAGSVSGADDIDLLRYYADDNKMKLCLYECSDNMKQKVADLFYYCGYNVGLQAVPNTTSRYWFNFIQCLPVYDQANNLAKLNKQQLDELTNKYQNGVTVYHHHTTWDFDQVKENWETSLLA